MKEHKEISESKSQFQQVADYCLCKFCPLLIIAFLLCTAFSFDDWRLYAIAASVLYIQHFNFKVGYSVGICEQHGLYPKDE